MKKKGIQYIGGKPYRQSLLEECDADGRTNTGPGLWRAVSTGRLYMHILNRSIITKTAV
jgi:hypothetical protein